MDNVGRKVVSVGEFFRQRFNKMIVPLGEPRSETKMGYNPPPQDPVRPKHPTPAPPKKEGVGELSVVFTLEEPKIEDGIPYGKLGYALLKHLRKQRQESNELG